MGLEQSFHYSCPQSSIQWGLSSSLTSLGVNTMLLNLLNSQRCSQWIYVSHSLGNVQIHQNSLMDGSFSCNVWFCTYIRYYASTYANCCRIYKHKPSCLGIPICWAGEEKDGIWVPGSCCRKRAGATLCLKPLLSVFYEADWSFTLCPCVDLPLFLHQKFASLVELASSAADVDVD